MPTKIDSSNTWRKKSPNKITYVSVDFNLFSPFAGTIKLDSFIVINNQFFYRERKLQKLITKKMWNASYPHSPPIKRKIK